MGDFETMPVGTAKRIEALEARVKSADALAEAALFFMESHCVDEDSGEMADRERLENAATAYRATEKGE